MFANAVSDETRLSSLIIESVNVMPATVVVRLCEMAIETHRKVIGRSLIYYRSFARMLFFTHVQNVRLRMDDNQSRANCFLTKIRYFTHKMSKCKLRKFFSARDEKNYFRITVINHCNTFDARLKVLFLRKWIIARTSSYCKFSKRRHSLSFHDALHFLLEAPFRRRARKNLKCYSTPRGLTDLLPRSYFHPR